MNTRYIKIKIIKNETKLRKKLLLDLVKTQNGWYGYKIMLPNSPNLEGTGLNFNDTLLCKSPEYDGALLSGFNIHGDPILDIVFLLDFISQKLIIFYSEYFLFLFLSLDKETMNLFLSIF